ncbi:MAG: aminotransferase class V-fold PLP-dependent enzyme, partial [Nitrospinaceae bacterium]|nr:cysteine desulfurase [Nitrospinaceae bacterium]NIR57679.1 cysteine desulfurase [Nitrospinaceae bacterium]NIS86225.1 cysteine desulfurase [Nitrospinaceae bacterium]NIT85021.1 cysteine desulfurase [Nitrospinaceae bacterium]NIU47190.1 cysteine desulfurase [Nitrospinaceae bacterium]
GFQISRLPVDRWGRISLEQLEEAITPATVLISIQHANNEVGTMQPVERIGEIARERGVLFHTDAVQSIGKLPVNVSRIPVDLLSVSAHKMYGPKGVGALFIRRGTPALFSLVCGGSQEKKRRGGTENLPGIVGFGKACELAARRLEEGEPDQIRTLRDYLDRRIRDLISEVQRFGHPESCLPNTLALGFKGTEGETLLIGLDLEGIAVSTGSACSSGSALPSPVLTALGVPHDEVNGSLRFSLGRHHTRQDMDRVAETLARRVALNREKTAAS